MLKLYLRKRTYRIPSTTTNFVKIDLPVLHFLGGDAYWFLGLIIITTWPIIIYECAGFVYMSAFLHAELAFSQYIAPLMADFTTADNNDSFVRFFDNGILLQIIAVTAYFVVKLCSQVRYDYNKATTRLQQRIDMLFFWFLVECCSVLQPITEQQADDVSWCVIKVGRNGAAKMAITVWFCDREHYWILSQQANTLGC